MVIKKNNKSTAVIPKHIGIIMDGNGRWAKKHGLLRTAGHARGAEVFQQIVRYCQKIGVEALTVYAFSTENWTRPKEEVDSIMSLLRQYLNDSFSFKDENIKITFIGDRDRLDTDLSDLMDEIEEVSKDNTDLKLNIAINYGGRQEILNAAKQLAVKYKEGSINLSEVDEEYFNNLLYTKDSPDPDIILRPSGEKRVSNFMLWQSAYSEFIYMRVLWPDFKPKNLDKAISDFNKRTRRYGGI